MIGKATKNLYPQVTNWDEKYGSFDSNGNKVEIDDALVEKEVERLQAEYDALQYQRDRASAFPSIGDQLDMQYWDQVNGTTTWQDAVAKVKSDNPK